jgi:hypothetical protein
MELSEIYKEGAGYIRLLGGKLTVFPVDGTIMDLKEFIFMNDSDYIIRIDQDDMKVVKYTKPKLQENDNFTKILEWQIAQQNAMEDRLDKRLKEYIKSFGSETKELAQSNASNQLDLSQLLPILQPILQKLTEGK